MIVSEDEYLDFSKVPESRGIPSVVYWVAVIGIIGIFAVGGATVYGSGYGHHWPANTTLRIDLSTMHE